MPYYKYVVVNKENKQMIGKIETENEDLARVELNELGFSIITLEESQGSEVKKNSKTFEFEGIDKKNTLIHGTIDSEERYKAFTRLLKEYELDVSYIVNQGLSDEERKNQKKIGVSDLLKQYQGEVQNNMKLYHEEKIKNIDRDFEKRKALIMRQIDFIMIKVNEFIEKFNSEINPQDLSQIKSFINKVLRLKNTTNLDYLRKTCKSFLQFLQDSEIFLQKKKRLKEKAKLYADAQDMISHLEKGKDFGVNEDLEDQMIRWQNDNIFGKEKISVKNKLQNVYYLFVLNIIHEDPEVKKIKKELYNIKNEIKQYYNLILKSKDKEYKQAAKFSVQKLIEKRNKLKLKLKKAKAKIRNNSKTGIFGNLISFLKTISGYLLLICIGYFFASLYISSKELIYTTPPLVFNIENLASFKHLFGASFLVYMFLSIKDVFFKQRPVAFAVILPVLILSLSIMVFNL